MDMRVVLIHFHLNTGGVTSVVRQQTEMLMAKGHDVLLVTGEAPPAKWPAHVAVVPGLAYDSPAGKNAVSAPETASAILNAIHRYWPNQRPDIVHVHNPTLAKNNRLQAVLKRLQQAGLILLCQIHDFAEDGRPNVYFDEPYLSDCHYAVVNGRDLQTLRCCGLKEDGVHHLPNAVQPLKAAPGKSAADTEYILYPVRAIRRKNIGVAILLQLCAFPSTPLAITLPPKSASELPSYDMWRRYVARQRLPIIFETGLQCDFQQMMAGSRYAITTSINEGFGFSFLEAWTAGKSLWGRLLPDICHDFIQRGVHLDHLYSRLSIPLDWIDADGFRRQWQAARQCAAQRYGMPVSYGRMDADWLEIAAQGSIDFGLLSEPFQRAVIDRVLSVKSASQRLQEVNPDLMRIGSESESHELIAANRMAILKHFSPAGYSNRLIDLYEKAMSNPIRQQIDKGALFSAFMTPSRFSMLKWSGFDG